MSLVMTEDRGAVRHIVINRPEKRNALNGDAIRELGGAIEAAAADDSVRVVVVRGEGAMFSSGMDLNDLRSLSESPAHLRDYRRPILQQAPPLQDGAAVRARAGVRLPHD